MDLSKLPRLSKTDTPPGDPTAVDAADAPLDPSAPPPAAPVAANFCANCGAPLRPGARFCDSCGAPLAGPARQAGFSSAAAPGIGAEVWVSAIIGLVLMLIGRSFASWVFAKMADRPYDTGATWVDGPRSGQPVSYWELEGFVALNDSGIFLFGLAMVLEALVLALVFTKFRAKVPLIVLALALTIVATAYNLFVSFKNLGAGLIPLTSLLAVAFGGYIAVYEWRLLQQFRVAPAPRP